MRSSGPRLGREPPAVTASLFEKMLEEKRRLTPIVGFHVIGVDTFELPGEALYLVGWYPTRSAADAAVAARRAIDADEVLHVYEPDPAS